MRAKIRLFSFSSKEKVEIFSDKNLKIFRYIRQQP